MSAQNPQNPQVFRYFLMFTTMLCGGLVMVVEVLGARVIGPYFGVSLFVWTALITVALLSLSAGYALGGYLADRRPEPEWLYGLITLSGLLVMLVPVMKPFVIQVTVPLGLRAGALVSATLLFAPSLLLLGCVSPYVVRIATSEWARLGRTVGVLYALSTVGSMIGTALAGYVIIAVIGVSGAFLVCGGLLVLLGLSYFLFFRRQLAALPGVAGLALLLWLPAAELPTAVTSDGTQVRLVEAHDGFYGSVKVVEYYGASVQTRELLIDGLIQGGIDQKTGASIYEYAYLLEALPLAVKPDTRSALIVGLGAGVLSKRLQDRGIDVEAIDIDPLVVQMAEKHFNLQMKRPVVIEDARYFLAQEGPRYDMIVMDAFTGDATPSHLLSREALERVKARLSPDGVVGMNIIGSTNHNSRFIAAVIRTLQTQFSDIAMFPLFDMQGGKETEGNLVLVAANRPLDAAFSAHPGMVHPLAKDLIALALRQGKKLPPQTTGLILTDDFNPLDVLDIELHENVRRNIMHTTPANILLHG